MKYSKYLFGASLLLIFTGTIMWRFWEPTSLELGVGVYLAAIVTAIAGAAQEIGCSIRETKVPPPPVRRT